MRDGTLKGVEGKPVELFLQQVVGLISAKIVDGSKVLDCILNLSEASEDAVRACKRIWDAKLGFLSISGLPQRRTASAPDPSTSSIETDSTMTDVITNNLSHKVTPLDPAAEKCNVPVAVVEVMVAGWLQNETVSKNTKDAVHLLAGLLGIVAYHFDVPKATLICAATFWQKVEDDLIQEEIRLVALRKALKARDPKGTTRLLGHIGVSDTTDLDEEIMKLPASVVDLVEKIGDDEVEMTFSLAGLTKLQRAAMGVPEGANTLMLQLSFDYNNDSSPSFCLHYNTDKSSQTLAHTRYVCSKGSDNPTKQICTSAQTALTWQLSRAIYSEIRGGTIGIADIFQHINTWLPKLAQLCVSCSARNAQYIQLRRSSPCTNNPYACAQLWYSLPLHVRVPEIRTDTFAVDMALTSVYAAAMADKPELLPNCPIRGSEYIKSVLNALPPMRVMRDAVNLSTVLASYHTHAEKLISWAVVHHRGFLATATGPLKIPNLPPGTHQFVLAAARPVLEVSSAHNLTASKRPTTVLFHGTSLDRLPAILAQGLRVCSGTALQRTGAVHGKGIYLSEDPATSFSYSPSCLSWKNSGLGNMRMMLGCEMVGPASKVTGNIHVVADPESVVVRYVMMFARDTARIPIRGHIEPAMKSGMEALRSGAA
ncbi:GID complex subunit containing RING finger motif [Didymella sp. IMI 355093]|nr:GID complex subunit containing RING finger motif [Didymella sp. IMI 355093]